MDKQPGPRRDQLPGAGEAARAHVAGVTLQSSECVEFGMEQDLDGLPYCNGRRILPKYLLDHTARCNNMQLDKMTPISMRLLRHCRAEIALDSSHFSLE
jgi:hypothetical protein